MYTNITPVRPKTDKEAPTKDNKAPTKDKEVPTKDKEAQKPRCTIKKDLTSIADVRKAQVEAACFIKNGKVDFLDVMWYDVKGFIREILAAVPRSKVLSAIHFSRNEPSSMRPIDQVTSRS